MAKTPKKPATSSAKPTRVKKPTAKVKGSTQKLDEARLKTEHDEIYQANREAIDKALGQCNGHLTKLTPEVAREVAQRLEKYYMDSITTSGGWEMKR